MVGIALVLAFLGITLGMLALGIIALAHYLIPKIRNSFKRDN